MKDQHTQKNYLSGPDELQLLTQRFRSGLEEWRDENNEPKLVNFGGKNNPLFSWKILLSGYLPEYLYEQQRLDTRIPFAELRKNAYTNPLAQAADQATDFATRIRAPDSATNQR